MLTFAQLESLAEYAGMPLVIVDIAVNGLATVGIPTTNPIRTYMLLNSAVLRSPMSQDDKVTFSQMMFEQAEYLNGYITWPRLLWNVRGEPYDGD